MTTLRERYIKRFGEAEAEALENAASMHENEPNGGNKGSDVFRWAICIAIGYECVEKPSYAKYHGIKVSFSDWKDFVRECADLGKHDGDMDYLGALCGAYKPFIKEFDKGQSEENV